MYHMFLFFNCYFILKRIQNYNYLKFNHTVKTMKEKIEHIIEKTNINTMVKEANKYESFYFIQDD